MVNDDTGAPAVGRMLQLDAQAEADLEAAAKVLGTRHRSDDRGWRSRTVRRVLREYGATIGAARIDAPKVKRAKGGAS